MSGLGYRQRYRKVIEQGFDGHYPSSNNALTLRHDEQGQGVCVPWALPYPFAGSEAPPGGQALQVRFSGVVSARPLADR